MASSATEAAFECMFLANDALTRYVAVHDAIRDQQSTVMSMMRSLFGGGPDFAKLYSDAKAVDELWSAVEKHVGERPTAFGTGFSPSERDFFNALVPYVRAMKHTTTLLLQRQKLLVDKSQGRQISMAEYQRIERQYADSVQTYVRLGASLQPLADRLAH